MNSLLFNEIIEKNSFIAVVFDNNNIDNNFTPDET